MNTTTDDVVNINLAGQHRIWLVNDGVAYVVSRRGWLLGGSGWPPVYVVVKNLSRYRGGGDVMPVSASLQTKLLLHSGIVASRPAFNDALCAFNVKMETDLLSSASEIAAPKLMKKLAHIYFTRVTQTAESTFSIFSRQIALWQSQMDDHTSDWIRVVPISGQALVLNCLGGGKEGRVYVESRITEDIDKASCILYDVRWMEEGKSGWLDDVRRCGPERWIVNKDGAVKALVEPSKKIDGRITVAQLASAKDSTASNVDGRKVYVGNVPWEVGSERLLECFAAFGEIEEGPLGFDKQSGRAKGFAFFVYKSEEGARRAVVDSVKSIDGHQVLCKMAVDGKKGRAGGGVMSPRGPVPGIVNTGGPSLLPHQNPPPSGTGIGPGYVNQVPPQELYAVAAATPEYTWQIVYRPLMNRLPPIQGGFADSGNYGPSSGYPTQPNMPPASPRGPHGGMYQGGHPYY
ncbi:UBP1-associated protein 2C-like protein [Tanacetum coccineum]